MVYGVFLIRLAGVVLIAPVVNYWWSSFPKNLTMEAYKLQSRQDQWAIGVAHYAPWLVYWWNTQKWFPGSSVIAGKPNFSASDWELVARRRSEGSPTPLPTRRVNLNPFSNSLLTITNLIYI